MINLRRRNYGAHKLGYHLSLSFFFISIRKKIKLLITYLRGSSSLSLEPIYYWLLNKLLIGLN